MSVYLVWYSSKNGDQLYGVYSNLTAVEAAKNHLISFGHEVWSTIRHVEEKH